MFTTFNAVLPVYEVVTPQTKQSFKVKSLTIADEEKMKASLMNESKILSHLNKCLYDSLAEKDPNYSFKDFLSGVTIKDRDALLYGLYHITYEEIRNYSVTCGACGKSHDVTVNASDTFSMDIYDGEEKAILEKRVPVSLEILEGVKVIIKQPTLDDENEVLRKFSFNANTSNDMLMKSLIIESFEFTPPEATSPEVYTERNDILQAYLSMPAKDKKLLMDAYAEQFGKYKSNLKMQVSCTSCGHTEVIDIDLVDNFFRAMYQ